MSAFKRGRHSLTRCGEAVDVDQGTSCNRSKGEIENALVSTSLENNDNMCGRGGSSGRDARIARLTAGAPPPVFLAVDLLEVAVSQMNVIRLSWILAKAS